MNNKKILFILAAIIGLGPLSIDMYLPAFPAIKLFFLTDISQVQLTLSSYLLGFALFHLACGPLSDYYGRRPVLIFGLLGYVVASLLCAFAGSIEQLIAFRFLQGIGACVAPVIGRAIVRDIFSKEDVIKALATVSALMAVAPVIAPTLGSILLEFGDWRWTFLFLAIAGCVTALLAFFAIEETLPQRQALTLSNIKNNLLTLLSDRLYIGSVMTVSFLYAPLFAFLSGAGFILIDYYDVPTSLFGVYFMFIVIGFVLGNFCTAKLVTNKPWQSFFKVGIGIAFTASIALFVGISTWHHPLAIILPVLMLTFTIGLVSPKAMGLALEHYPHMAATASALMGFLQMLAASAAGFFVGLFLTDSPLPMAFVILGCVLLSAVSCFFLLRQRVDQESVSEAF